MVDAITSKPSRVVLIPILLTTVMVISLTGCHSLSNLKPGDSRIDEYGIAQVWVPAGKYLRGTSKEEAAHLSPPAWAVKILKSEQPKHVVHITRGYWIDKYEVTNQAYQAFIDHHGYDNRTFWSEAGWQWLNKQDKKRLPYHCPVSTLPGFPRVCVTWYEAEAYARWRGGRLPTEAEWEYAARGPQSLIYPWGDVFDPAKANVTHNKLPTAVGNFPGGISWVGAYDMAGNAMEWVQDWLGYDYYLLKESKDPQGPKTGKIKVEKGGWYGSNAFVARSAYHHFEDPPGYQDHHIGFRIVTDDNR